MNQTILNRIQQIANNEDITITALERIIGASKGVLSRAIANGTDIQAKWVTIIVENYQRYNAEWLLTGEGSMFKTDTPVPVAASEQSEGIPLISDSTFVSLANTKLSEQSFKQRYNVPEFSAADFLIHIKGDSMTPLYNSGDIVACQLIKNLLFFQWNRVYALCTKSQGILIKRVNPSEKPEHVRLMSDNTTYPPFNIPLSDITTIALVIGSIRVE